MRSSVIALCLALLVATSLSAGTCPRCTTEVGDAHNYCFECGLPLKDPLKAFADRAETTAALLRADPGPKPTETGETKILSHDRREGWLWIDRGKDDGLLWGGYYTVYHGGAWKGLVRIRRLEATRSRCKLVLGDLADVRDGYRLAPFENLDYDVVRKAPGAHVGSPVVWYGRLVDHTPHDGATLLHVSTTWKDGYRELRETFGREKGLFKSYAVSDQARIMVERSIVRGSFLASFSGRLPAIPKDAKILVVGTPLQELPSPAGKNAPPDLPTLRVFHLKYWKGTSR